MGTRPDQPTMNTAALWAGWWITLLAIWFLLVDTTAPQELVAGAASAAVAATLAVNLHRRGYIQFQPRAAWLRQTPELVWNVVTDCGVLGSALWRKVVRRDAVEGSTVRVPFHHGGDNGRDGARRALVNFAVSLTPNSYVIDIDPEADSLLVHRLVAGPLDGLLQRQQQRAEIHVCSTAPPNGDEGVEG